MEHGPRMASYKNLQGLLSPARWSELRAIFFEAIDQPPASREEYILHRCATAEQLQDLKALLAAHENPAGILDNGPPVALSSDLPPVLEPGALLSGRYRIVRLIARGGMGEVYEARDLKSCGAPLAVKTLGAHNLSRFKRENRLAGRISHPNVCRVFNLLTDKKFDPPLLYLTMELLDGITVAARIRNQGAFPADEAARVGIQVAEGLATAHYIGILHCDLKPSNIILVGDRAVITDFGLARLRSDANPARPCSLVGTVNYLSPEQIEGAPADFRSDVWALGIVLCEIFTSKPPILAQAGPRLRGSGVRPGWKTLIRRCLQRDPIRRFADAMAVCAAIRETVTARSEFRSRTASSGL
jgi:serine/threonine protein kinase